MELIGQQAPDFELKDQHGNQVKLSSFRGQMNVVVLFYPFAFTGTCTGELCGLRDQLELFQNDDVQLLAISCDSIFTLRVFAEKESYSFPLLSDHWPHGAVATKYGVFDEARGAAIRGTFIIDKAGIVRWQIVNAISDARNLDEYKAALATL